MVPASYAIHGLAPGNYMVCFAAYGDSSSGLSYGYVRECYNGQINGYDTVTAPATGIDATLPPAGAVEGTVTGDDGSPVSNAFVIVNDSNGVGSVCDQHRFSRTLRDRRGVDRHVSGLRRRQSGRPSVADRMGLGLYRSHRDGPGS